MTEPTTTPQNQSGFGRALPWLLSALLISNFLWRAFTVADEYPPRSVQVFQMVLDAAMLIALVGIFKRVPPVLFIVALVCGIGLFGIRLHSDASWWTGHWHYALDRR